MSELPIHLKVLEPLPGALDIIRLLGENENQPADVDWICDSLDMSDRRFGKAIRRLATTGYVQMNPDSDYLLTEKGIQAAQDLAEFDAAGPREEEVGENKVTRRLLVALPQTLVAGQTSEIAIGFQEDTDAGLDAPTDVVLRVTTTHALLSGNGDEMLKLDNSSAHQNFHLTPEMYNEVRVRVQVYQLAPNGEDINMCGGLYVDVPVVGENTQAGLVAYGADIHFDPA